jgi:hypothetical protein
MGVSSLTRKFFAGRIQEKGIHFLSSDNLVIDLVSCYPWPIFKIFQGSIEVDVWLRFAGFEISSTNQV